MRAVIQRVSEARVRIAGTPVGEIGPGLLVLLGIAPADTDADAQWLADKIARLRIFPDADGHLNRSLLDLAPSSGFQRSTFDAQLPPPLPPPQAAPTALVVSQFTLFASTRKGTRPSFNDAAKPDVALPLYETFCRLLSAALGRPVATGQFGALMAVSLVNDGPVTLIIDSRQRE